MTVVAPLLRLRPSEAATTCISCSCAEAPCRDRHPANTCAPKRLPVARDRAHLVRAPPAPGPGDCRRMQHHDDHLPRREFSESRHRRRVQPVRKLQVEERQSTRLVWLAAKSGRDVFHENPALVQRRHAIASRHSASTYGVTGTAHGNATDNCRHGIQFIFGRRQRCGGLPACPASRGRHARWMRNRQRVPRVPGPGQGLGRRQRFARCRPIRIPPAFLVNIPGIRPTALSATASRSSDSALRIWPLCS